MGDVLELDGVSVRRGGRNIVDHVSWSVNEGERWVVLGPNGAGKTTIMQLISARLHPTSGKVYILGEQIGRTDLTEIRPLVGYASSALDARIPASEKVIDAVLTGAYGTTSRWREEFDDDDVHRATALLSTLGIGSLTERVYGTLSSGERKRVGIARALMPNPEILVLDEPASGLDLAGREELLASLTALADEVYAPVIVLVTHHVEEIPPGFTHALLLRDGVVSASGEIQDVMTADALSKAFGLGLEVTLDEGRYTARAAR